MNAFSDTLSQLMQHHQWTQSALHAMSGVGQGLISLYLNPQEQRLPDDQMLVKLVRVFSDGDGNALIAAWLCDKVPDELAGRVKITPTHSEGEREAPVIPAGPPGYAHLPRRVRELVDEVAVKAKSPNVYSAIDSTLSLTRQ